MLTPVVFVFSAVVFSAAAPSDPAPVAMVDASAPAIAFGDQVLTSARMGDAGEAPPAATIQAEAGRWNIEFAPYLWAPTLKSKTEAGTVKLSFSDILDDLDFTFMSALTAEKSGSPWGFMADAIYMDLEDGPVELQSTILSVDVTYRLQADRPTKVFVGARYWDVDVSAGPFGGTVDWIDGLVGATTVHEFNEKLSANVLADVGGFGVGASADITWQGIGTLNYQIKDGITLGAGYRWLHVDQEQKTEFDTDIYGPIVGLRISL